jgi:hypothetical protein
VSSSQDRSRWQTETIEQAHLAVHVVSRMRSAAVSGVLAGVSSYVSLEGLDQINEFRLEYGWLLFLLPAAGLVIGLGYHHLGGRPGQGTALLIDRCSNPANGCDAARRRRYWQERCGRAPTEMHR